MTLQRYQLSRHLLLVPTSEPDRVVARNLAEGSELELSVDEWRSLAPFGSAPVELDADEQELGALEKRALERSVLVALPERTNVDRRTAQLRFELTQLLRLSTRLPKRDFEAHVKALADGRPATCGLLEVAKSFFRAFNRARAGFTVKLYQPWFVGLCERYMIGLFDHLAAFYAQTHEAAQEPYELDVELCLDGMRRPPCDAILNQLPIMPVSTVARARHVAEQLTQGARVLVLGDDDLFSLALGERRRDLEIHAVEVDERLLAVLRDGAERRDLRNVSYHTVDLGEGLPDEMCEAFDAVVCDPPYNAGGMTAFIVAARRAMRRGTNSPTRLCLSTNPDLIHDREQFFRDLEENQLVILARRRHFNQYPMIPGFIEENIFHYMTRFGYPLKARQQLLVCPYYYSDLFDCVFVEDARTHSARFGAAGEE